MFVGGCLVGFDLLLIALLFVLLLMLLSFVVCFVLLFFLDFDLWVVDVNWGFGLLDLYLGVFDLCCGLLIVLILLW